MLRILCALFLVTAFLTIAPNANVQAEGLITAGAAGAAVNQDDNVWPEENMDIEDSTEVDTEAVAAEPPPIIPLEEDSATASLEDDSNEFYEDEYVSEDSFSMDPMEECDIDGYSDNLVLSCLQERLAKTEADHNTAVNQVQSTAADKTALARLSNSNMAFSAYIESECIRQRSNTDQYKINPEFVYTACKIRMYNDRIETLSE